MTDLQRVLADYSKRWDYLEAMTPEAVVELARKGKQAAEYLAWSDRVLAAGHAATQAKREAPKQQKASEVRTVTQPKADGS